MALTVTQVRPGDTQVLRVVEVTFDSSYPTGGLALTPAQCGLSAIDVVICEQATGYLVQYVSGKLVVRTTTTAHTHTENTAGSYAQNATTAAATAAAASQVANTTDLSTLVLRVLVVGRV